MNMFELNHFNYMFKFLKHTSHSLLYLFVSQSKVAISIENNQSQHFLFTCRNFPPAYNL